MRYAAQVSHVIEPASSGRSKCRGCGRQIQRGEIRFGESLPNPYADGELTVWFHPGCAACKRPEPFLETLKQTATDVPDREGLARVALFGLAHPRVVRIDGVERSRSGQAKCRSCHEPIARDEWRIRLAFFEEGRSSPGGYIHLNCRMAYFDTGEILEHVLRFSPQLSDSERETLLAAFSAGRSEPVPSVAAGPGASSSR